VEFYRPGPESGLRKAPFIRVSLVCDVHEVGSAFCYERMLAGVAAVEEAEGFAVEVADLEYLFAVLGRPDDLAEIGGLGVLDGDVVDEEDGGDVSDAAAI
jgi:hypothetical protein